MGFQDQKARSLIFLVMIHWNINNNVILKLSLYLLVELGQHIYISKFMMVYL